MNTLVTLLVLPACVLLVAELVFVVAIFAPQAVVRAVRRLAGPWTRTSDAELHPLPRPLSVRGPARASAA